VRAFDGRAPYHPEIDKLLESGEVLGHELVYGQLLLLPTTPQREVLLQTYARLPVMPTVPHKEVLAFIRARELSGRGVDWLGVHLLASAMASSSRLYTADEALMELAVELEVAHA